MVAYATAPKRQFDPATSAEESLTLPDKVARKGESALLLSLASGQTVRDAALSAGVSEKTVNRRLADPAFRQQVAELRSEMVSRAMGKMAEGMVEAAETLRKLL